MDKKDRIILESVLYLFVTAILVTIMIMATMLLTWDLDYEMIFDIKATSMERIAGLRIIWSALSVLNGACTLWTIRFNKWFGILSFALFAACLLNRLAIQRIV